MNKARVEAFTDAVAAIILTIMVLEFKVPESYHWHDLFGESSNLVAYIISFIYICVAWYNHHYMFSLAKQITKKIYWVNNVWLLTMSLIPVSTAWIGEFPSHYQPAFFYLLIFALWSLAYLWLSAAVWQGNPKDKLIEKRIKRMSIYRVLLSPWLWLGLIAICFISYYFPPTALIVTVIELIMMMILTNEDSDKLF